jgi:GST-like protein
MDDLVLYMWATPNSRRVSILFEELGFDFDVKPVNIRLRQQFEPELLALNPFAKVPIAVWQDNGTQRVLAESGAILLHFAEFENRFLPNGGKPRDQALMWLMVALTALGPHSSQAHHWSDLTTEASEPALRHQRELVTRVYRLLNDQLENQQYLADDYSVADIAAYPWIDVYEWTTLDIKDFPNLDAWRKRVGERPAVIRGMALPAGVTLE